jgi:alanine-glyoxylate transaminase/serine-glyoxylate transaminase/serine-pyruvate transaminase
MTRSPGRSLLQLPGPTNVPDAVLRSIAEPTIDHRSAVFSDLAIGVLADLRVVFGTDEPIALYAGSGTGGWEAALQNTLSGGDRVLICETGYFAAGWARLATKLGLDVITLPTDWRSPADVAAIEATLSQDAQRTIKAVLVVHNETSTGVRSDVARIRKVIDQLHHPALLLVDCISSLGSMPVCHDEWEADVTIACSQKGLMLPPGLTMLAVSQRARDAKRTAKLPCAYWDWDPVLEAATTGFFPNTPATNLIVGLRTALNLLQDEGLDEVLLRHRRHANAVRAAVTGWGLSLLCKDPESRSDSITAVLLPEGVSDVTIRRHLLEHFSVTIGGGLGKWNDRCLRFGHLGDLNDVMLIAACAAVEMSLVACHVSICEGGVAAAMSQLTAQNLSSAEFSANDTT